MNLIFKCFIALFIGSTIVNAYPQVDPSIQTLAECESKGGDWSEERKLCTIYVSDGSDSEGDPQKQAPLIFEDGCFQMYQRFNGGVNDAGAICLSGLADEAPFLRLKIVTVDTVGHVHFCGDSHQFSPLSSTPQQAYLDIQVLQPAVKIVFSGKPNEGRLQIGSQNFQFIRLANELGHSFFSQCRY